MNYKIILFFFLLVNISCVDYNVNIETTPKVIKNPFSNKGFALIYNRDLYDTKIISNRIPDRSLIIFQKNLKPNSAVKVTNLLNSSYIIAKVGKKTNYPGFYNSVISDRISKELKVDLSEPYLEIKEIYDNSLFIAKKTKTHEEEKKVATKVPIDDVKIQNLSNIKNKKNGIKKRKFSYTVKIADFYFKESAELMKARIIKETEIKNVNINTLSANKFRVFLGPYKNLNSLKKSFNAIRVLEFENIEIIKN